MDESSGSLKKARALLESSPLLQQVAFTTDVAWQGDTDAMVASDDEYDTGILAHDDGGEEMREIVPEIVLSIADASVLKRVEGIMARTSASRSIENRGLKDGGRVRLLERGMGLQDLVGSVEGKLVGMGEEDRQRVALGLVHVLQHVCHMYQQQASEFDYEGKVLFHWAVVLSDIARLVRDVDERIEYAVASCLKYAGVVSMEGDHAQALNNWGLVICDVANCVQGEDVKRRLYRVAISRFRKAIRMDCHSVETQSRCCYNLGTVMHQYAGMHGDGDMSWSHAAQYIAMSYALDPSSEIFCRALVSVHQFLPLPYVRCSKMVHIFDECPQSNSQQQWVVAGLTIDAFHLRSVQISSIDVKAIHETRGSDSGIQGSTHAPPLMIDVASIASYCLCHDPWIPFGTGLHIRLKSKPDGIYIASESAEDILGWRDVLCLLQVLHGSSGGLQKLQSVLESNNKLDIL